VNRLEECAALAAAVGRDEIGVLADYYHMRLGFEPLEDICAVEGSLGHAHIARPLGRLVPSDGDGEPYDILFRELRAIGYDERVSVEAYIPEDFEVHAGAAQPGQHTRRHAAPSCSHVSPRRVEQAASPRQPPKRTVLPRAWSWTRPWPMRPAGRTSTTCCM
jgi:hypothetical protein